MKFTVENPNYELSPHTGITRAHWIEAAKYLLRGLFSNIHNPDDPVVMPRYEDKVTYPNKNTPPHKVQAEYFEGLTRSFFIAAPLIHIEPELELEGIGIRDYYRSQVLRSCTPGDVNYVYSYAELEAMSEPRDPFWSFQQTVETCALVICLWMCKAEIWDSYTKTEQDTIAAFLDGYARGNTVPHNWRLFNMLDMAFLHMVGYEIDEDIMMDHAQTVLSYYVGDGWYRDGHSFDYYSCWAFNVYAPLWNLWYGYEHAPYIAERFEAYSNKLMESYPDFFDRDGFTNMWGRSNIYRNAATSAFDGNLFLKQPGADPGLARRICSGSLLQFLERDDVFYKGVPCLGFYRPFLPLVQPYSCAESPYWLGKAFLCLHLPAEHPFWTAKEHNGSWEQLAEGEVKLTCLDGPALCFSNHQANGMTELRTGKVVKGRGDEHGMWNYSKLVFNSKFPWESAPDREVEAQQYVLRDLSFDVIRKCNVTFWHGQRDAVLYRRQFFDYDNKNETQWMTALNLADFTVPYGILRVDKLRYYQRPLSLTLGAFGFPDNGTELLRREKDGAQAIILKGHDHMDRPRQMAMSIFHGWEQLNFVKSQNTNPDSEHSIVVYASLRAEKQYGYGPYVLISQVITKESLEDFSEDELFPVRELHFVDKERCGGYGPVELRLADGTVRRVDYEPMEGRLLL